MVFVQPMKILRIAFFDCDVVVVPPECSNHRGFNESVIDMVLTRSAVNKNIYKLNLLLADLMNVKATLPDFIDDCCSPMSGVEYPVPLVSISTASFAFHETLVQFNQDNELFLTILTE